MQIPENDREKLRELHRLCWEHHKHIPVHELAKFLNADATTLRRRIDHGYYPFAFSQIVDRTRDSRTRAYRIPTFKFYWWYIKSRNEFTGRMILCFLAGISVASIGIRIIWLSMKKSPQMAGFIGSQRMLGLLYLLCMAIAIGITSYAFYLILGAKRMPQEKKHVRKMNCAIAIFALLAVLKVLAAFLH